MVVTPALTPPLDMNGELRRNSYNYIPNDGHVEGILDYILMFFDMTDLARPGKK